MIKTIAFGKASVDDGVSQHASTTSHVHPAPSIAHGRNQNSVRIVVQDSKVASWQDSAAHLVSQRNIPAKNRMAIGVASRTQLLVRRFLMRNGATVWPRGASSHRLRLRATLKSQRDCFAHLRKQIVVQTAEKDSKGVCLGAPVGVDSDRHTSAFGTLNKASGVVCRIQWNAQIALTRACGIGAFTRGNVNLTEHHGVVAKRKLSQARLCALEKNRLKHPIAKKILKDVSYWASAKKGSKLLGNAETVEEYGRDPQIHQHVKKLQLMARLIVFSRVNSILN